MAFLAFHFSLLYAPFSNLTKSDGWWGRIYIYVGLLQEFPKRIFSILTAAAVAAATRVVCGSNHDGSTFSRSTICGHDIGSLTRNLILIGPILLF